MNLPDEIQDEFWLDYAAGVQELAEIRTVDQVIEICLCYFGKSDGDAFFPGGCGDVEILTVLLDAGWCPVWIQAGYYFAIRQPRDVCKVCHEPIKVVAQVDDNFESISQWVHSHAGNDQYCRTGDGSVAAPNGTDGLTYVEGDIYRGIQRPVI